MSRGPPAIPAGVSAKTIATEGQSPEESNCFGSKLSSRLEKRTADSGQVPLPALRDARGRLEAELGAAATEDPAAPRVKRVLARSRAG